MSDFRYAVRTLRNQPGFTLITALLLALGIGANCVVFSALDAVLLRRLPVRDPDRLFRVVQNLPQLGKRSDMQYPVYDALRNGSTMASDVFGETVNDVALTEPGPAEQIRVHLVTDNYFTAVGVGARYGRVLLPDDTQSAVLSYGFWQRRFSGDPRAVGRTIVLHGHRFVVVGVLPKAFNGFSIDTAPDVRLPLKAFALLSSDGRSERESSYFDLAIRLRPGVTPFQAAAETNAIWRRAATVPGETDAWRAWRLDKGIELESLEHGISRMRERFSGALAFLVAAVGLLLLMVCANVAGLLLARSATRRQEISVRLALGATAARIVRQMLAESLLMTAIGGAGGFAIAFLSAPLLTRALPPVRDFAATSVPLALRIEPDLRVLAFSLVLCVATTVLFGLVPAIEVSRVDLHSVLRSARASGSWRGRQFLVIFQVALCTLLLVGAGLLLRTFEQLRHLDAGFDRDHIVTFSTDPRLNSYTPEQAVSLRTRLLERVQALAGVRSAAIAGFGLMRGTGLKMSIGPAGQKTSPAAFLNASSNAISPEYFDTMGMRLVAGRLFTEADNIDQKRRARVVVNQTFARRFFPDQDPIGKAFGMGLNVVVKDDFEIIGTVTDAKYRSLREPIQPTLYRLFAPDPKESPPFYLHVRTSGRPEAVIELVRQILQSIDPQLPIVEIHTLAEEVETSLWSERLVATLASVFAGLAALLAAVGLYGLLAYAVAQRRREIGIRMALGAKPGSIRSLIYGRASVMVCSGIAIGLGATLAVGPALRSLLFGISPADKLTMIAVVLFVALIATVATAIPAARAMRVDPAVALRQEN